MPEPQATLIIVNYNGSSLLARSVPAAVEAARRAGGHAVMVADDGSTDDSIEQVCRTHPEVEVRAFPHRGFGPACNAAVAAANTEVAVLLNSDIVVSHDFLPPLLADLQATDVFAVGCKFLNPDGSLTNALGNRTCGRWRRGLFLIHHETEESRLGETCHQLYANGAAMAFVTRKWQALGGFDPMYHPFYWEDTDLGYRAWGRGWRVLYEPASVVRHDQGSTMRKTHRGEYVELISARNGILFAWKNFLDTGLLRRTLMAQARWTADDVLIDRVPARARALWMALRRLPAAARGRIREQRERVRSDQQILSACTF